MPKIPMAVQSYRLDSVPAQQQRLVNLFAERLPPDSKSPVIVRNVPGLALWVEVPFAGVGKVQNMIAFGPYIVVAVSNNVGSFTLSYINPGTGVATAINNVPGPIVPLTMAASATELAICAGGNGYVVTYPGWGFAQIVDVDFPANVTSVTYLDGYFVWSIAGSDQYVISAVLNAMAYDPLDFAAAESTPDDILRVFTLHEELWLFGSRTIEVHANTGAVAFPFQRQSGGTIDVGTISRDTVCECDNSVFWLGSDLIVYRSEGYRQKRVSTHAIEQEIQTFVRHDTAHMYALNFNGHQMCVLKFPNTSSASTGPGRTYVYDAATDLWHERSTSIVDDQWLPDCSLRYGGLMLVGGWQNGRVLQMVAANATDDGLGHPQQIYMPPIWAETGLGFMHRLEVEVETGLNASEKFLSLEISDNSGTTWTTASLKSMGTSGVHDRRVYWTRLGRFRQRLIRFGASGAVLKITGVDVRGDFAKEG